MPNEHNAKRKGVEHMPQHLNGSLWLIVCCSSVCTVHLCHVCATPSIIQPMQSQAACIFADHPLCNVYTCTMAVGASVGMRTTNVPRVSERECVNADYERQTSRFDMENFPTTLGTTVPFSIERQQRPTTTAPTNPHRQLEAAIQTPFPRR